MPERSCELSSKSVTAIILDISFILLHFQRKIDFLHELYLNLEGKTRFLIFKQTLNDLEHGIWKSGNKKADIKMVRKAYRSSMVYLERHEKTIPIYFIDDMKNKEESPTEFILKMCKALRKEYKKVYLATTNEKLIESAGKKGVSIFFLNNNNQITLK